MVTLCCLYFATIFEKFFSNLSLCLINLALMCPVCPQEERTKEDSAELEGGRRVTVPQAGSVEVHTASSTCTIWGTIEGDTSPPPAPGSRGWQHWQLNTAQASVIEAFGPTGKGLFYVENCSGFWRNNFSLGETEMS